MADAIHAEIEKLKKEDISDDELKMIKTRTKANLIRGLADNEGLATQLAIYQTRYGDWRELFRSVDRIDQVTKATFAASPMKSSSTPTAPSASSKTQAAPVAVAAPRLAEASNPAPPIREVGNEIDNDSSADRSGSMRWLYDCSSSRGPSHKLAASSNSTTACIQAAAAQAHSAVERHGDLPAGRS